MRNYLLLIAIISALYCKAQSNFCGTDAIKQSLLHTYPTYEQEEKAQNKRIYDYLSSNASTASNRTVYTIPMVFHILHQNGPENVPDINVINAVNEMNLRFQNAAPYFDATGNAVNIQFCLATVDPWGNPTTGITRDTSFRTNLPYTVSVAGPSANYWDVVRLKNVNRWCPRTYLNVWVLKSTFTFANYPSPYLEEIDGIVGLYGFLTGGFVLSHEVGHYLNLFHTFQGGCTNYNCMLDGDHVCDTPPQADVLGGNVCGVSSCATDMNDTSGFNPFTTDRLDLPNYMGNAPCPFSFSQGQATRMEAALTLLRPTLLQSNGCGAHPGGAVPVASFTIDSSLAICSGTFSFHSTSNNSLYTSWDFDNDGRTDTVGTNVTHTFTVSGFYPVKMMVTGFGGADTVTHIIHVFVNPYPTYPVATANSGYSIDPILNKPVACKGASITLNGVPGMAHYQWSTGQTTQSITFVIDSTKELYLTVINAGGRSISNCVPFKIIVNPRLRLTRLVGNDTINCQDLVVYRLLPNPYWFPATNTWYRNGNFLSANQFVLSSYGYPPGYQSFWVQNNVDPIGCVTNSDTVSLYANAAPPVFITQVGNVLTLPFRCNYTQWFRDGIPLTVNDSVLTVTVNGCYSATCLSCETYYSDTVCITNVGIKENNFDNNITVIPNPAATTITMKSNTSKIESLSIYNVLGECVYTEQNIAKNELNIDVQNYSKGVYFIRIADNNKSVVNKKIMVQ
jgi:PKD repeat protein